MAGVNKRPSDMTPEMSRFFEKCPKHVIFEIALGLGYRLSGEESTEMAFGLMQEEWQALYDNRIVSQRPVR